MEKPSEAFILERLVVSSNRWIPSISKLVLSPPIDKCYACYPDNRKQHVWRYAYSGLQKVVVHEVVCEVIELRRLLHHIAIVPSDLVPFLTVATVVLPVIVVAIAGIHRFPVLFTILASCVGITALRTVALCIDGYAVD